MEPSPRREAFPFYSLSIQIFVVLHYTTDTDKLQHNKHFTTVSKNSTVVIKYDKLTWIRPSVCSTSIVKPLLTNMFIILLSFLNTELRCVVVDSGIVCKV